MKKLVSCLLVLAVLVLGCITATASDGKVEIVFCVGDSTLMINGSQVTVEKPYVVGEGVTLVPIRVITEAFGAKVDWIEETQTVKLSYPDVEIVIQINNPVAEVNGKAETLLAAPELTASGYTMIPLRFISENFGAEVSYDDATGGITVTKEISDGGVVSIEGSVNSKYIGDSFYGWSMENPLDMNMSDRSFDGMNTSFVDGDNEIYIEIFSYDPEDYDFEKEYNEFKMNISGFTLVKADKDTSDEKCKWMHFGVKDQNDYYDYQHFVTTEYVYVVSGLLSNADTKIRDNYLNILSTFECAFKDGDIHDLSNIKDGFRRFESDHLKFSFDVPENFYMSSSDESQNQFDFYEIDNGVSGITAVVYSKSDVESAESLANEDYNHNKKVMNETMTKFSDGVVEKQYDSISAHEYTYTLESDAKAEHKRDVFFEVGDYVYNVAVSIELPHDNYDEYIDKIINSIKAEPLNSEEIGVLMKNVPVATGTFDATVGKATIKLPNIYIEVASSDSAAMYLGSVNGVMISFMKTAGADMTLNDLKKTMQDTENNMKEENDAQVIKSTYETTINNQKFYAFLLHTTSDDESVYTQQYVCLNKGSVYVLAIACPDYLYSQSTQAEIEGIVKSITFE